MCVCVCVSVCVCLHTCKYVTYIFVYSMCLYVMMLLIIIIHNYYNVCVEMQSTLCRKQGHVIMSEQCCCKIVIIIINTFELFVNCVSMQCPLALVL